MVLEIKTLDLNVMIKNILKKILNLLIKDVQHILIKYILNYYQNKVW